MLLEVKQIKDIEVRDKGNKVPDPTKSGAFLKKEKVVTEAIDIRRIKAAREFKRGTSKKHESIEGDITVLYLYPETAERQSTELHIVHNYEQFLKDVNNLESGREIQEPGS